MTSRNLTARVEDAVTDGRATASEVRARAVERAYVSALSRNARGTRSEFSTPTQDSLSRAVAESMRDGLFTLDADGRVTYVNQAAEMLLGSRRGNLLGRVMHDTLDRRAPDGSELSIEDCPMMRTLRERVRTRIEDDVFLGGDGRRVRVAYNAAPYETATGTRACVVVFHGISQRRGNHASVVRDVDTPLWIGRIRDALAQDRFLLYAQPIVQISTGRTVQQELLLRVREPDGSVVAPSPFLRIAEEHGLVGEIDRWVIGHAAEIVATSSRSAINISALSVGDPGILEHLERCVEASGADPALLVLEVTETAIIEDEDAARAFAERAHGLGCKLALDDFGTGYGSFTYLKKLPLDVLKISIEFVRDLASNAASRHVVAAIIALAHAFDLQTVAEGVEGPQTMKLLGELGVDFAQGYHIARPQPLLRSGTATRAITGRRPSPFASRKGARAASRHAPSGYRA